MSWITINSDHPIIFVHDVENEQVVVPRYAENSPVSFNKTCISVVTRSYVDGETKVRLRLHPPQTQSELVFDGEVCTPSGSISVNTSETESILFSNTKSSITRVCIWMDDMKYPNIIDIYISPAK